MEKQAPAHRGGYLEALLNSSPVAIIATNAEGAITFANKEAGKLVERELPELIGESIVTVYESLEAARETNRQLYQHGGVIKDWESKAKTKSGKIVPTRVSAAHLKDSAGNYIGAVGFFEKYRPWSGAEIKVQEYTQRLESQLEKWKSLSTPVFELYPGLSVVVIVGHLDASRFEQLTAKLLSHVKEVKTRVAFIDFSAAVVDDTNVANQVLKTIRTLRLLGVESVLAGIQTSLAQAIEAQVTDLTSIKSFCCTDMALEAALNSLGFEIHQKS